MAEVNLCASALCCTTAISWPVQDHRAVLAPQWRGSCHRPPCQEEPTQLAFDAWQEQDVEHDKAQQFVDVQDQCDGDIQVTTVDNTALSFVDVRLCVCVYLFLCVHCGTVHLATRASSVYNPTFLVAIIYHTRWYSVLHSLSISSTFLAVIVFEFSHGLTATVATGNDALWKCFLHSLATG